MKSLAGVMTQTGSSATSFSDAREWQEFTLDLDNLRGKIEDLTPAQGWQAMYDALHRTLVNTMTQTSDFALVDSTLIAPTHEVNVVAKPSCSEAKTYRGGDPKYGSMPRDTCLPAGTAFPVDSTFSSLFVFPTGTTPLFNRRTPQSLPFATDIADGDDVFTPHP